MTLTLSLILAAAVALALTIRLAPLDPARWHTAIRTDAAATPGPCASFILPQRNGARAACLLPGTPAQVLMRLTETALATPRTTLLAGSVEAGRISWVTRSHVMRYPDVTTAQATETPQGTRLDVHARQVYGAGDWGVNAARLKDWLSHL